MTYLMPAYAGQSMSCNQAVEVLNALRLLLGSHAPSFPHQAESPWTLPHRAVHHSRVDRGTQTSPLHRGSQAPGQIARLDSAHSHAQQAARSAYSPFHSGSQEMPSADDDTPLDAAAPAAMHVTKAMPPPPSHAEHAVGQSCHMPDSSHDSKPPLPSWQSQAVEAHRRQSIDSQCAASRQQSCTGSGLMFSPFGEVRRLSSQQEGSRQPSNASDQSQGLATRLQPHISQALPSTQSNAAYRQSSSHELPASICPSSRQTSNASQQSQKDGNIHVASSPFGAAFLTASMEDGHKASHGNVQKSQRHGSSDRKAEGKRFSNWADQQMAQSQTHSEGSPASAAPPQPELGSLPLHNLSGSTDHKAYLFFGHHCAVIDK